MNDRKFYTKKTIECWDEAAEIHARHNSDLIQKISSRNYNGLEYHFNKLVDSLDVCGKSIVQVCCNNGKDLISIKNKRAGKCVGIDGSTNFIEQAKKLAKSSGHKDVDFVCHDVYEIPDVYTAQFDYAVVTVGVFNWMPDISAFIKVCSSLIKPGGWLLVEELHPVLNMYAEGEPSYIANSYFDRSAQLDTEGLDYFSGNRYSAKENYYFQHTFSDILMSAISADLTLRSIEEVSENVGNYCADLELSENNPPLAFVASWQKHV